MVNLNFSEVEQKEVKKSTKIKGFSIEDCTITGIIASKTQGGKDQIEVGFISTGGLEHTERMSLSSGAMKYTLQKLHTLASRCISPEDVSKDMSLDLFNKLLTGKKVRIKFSAEEFRGTDDNIYTRAVIGLWDFAEEISVPRNETKLKLDKESRYDYKPLEGSTTTTTPPKSASAMVDDLPF